MVYAGEALAAELLEERARTGQPGEPEVARELAQRRAQGRRTVKPCMAAKSNKDRRPGYGSCVGRCGC